MIYGIGTDIVAVARMREALERHGDRFAERILSTAECTEFSAAKDKARFLAKRFAAKEAFSKAYGTGIRAPLTLAGIAVSHDALGKPLYLLADSLAAVLQEKKLQAHLSLSDEAEYVVAFAILTQSP